MNPWTEGRVPDVAMYPTLGAWLNRRKLASAAWSPPHWVRLALTGAHAYWYEFPQLVLTSQQTLLTRVTINEDFWMFALLGQATQVVANRGSFRAQIYEDEADYKFSKYGLNQLNAFPIAQEPGMLRIPHYMPPNFPVLCRVQNLTTVANTVNLALFGYSRWFR